MRLSMFVLLSSLCVSSLALGACGGSKQEAKGPESDPWSGYTGKYAEVGTPTAKTAKADKPKKEDAPAPSDAPAAAPVAAKADPSAAPKVSSATIHGESVSSIGLDSLVDTAKTTVKGKIVATKYLVGPKYEQLSIQMKGATVEVIRPAANPAPDGPTFSSPKARSGEASKGESSYYDADADVAVVVKGATKPAAAKVLGNLVKR